MSSLRKVVFLGTAVFLASVLSACTTIEQARGGPGKRMDPWENWNRKVFAFNEGLDKNVLKPVSTVYANVIPQPVRQSVDNVFSNIADGWSAVNNVLQGKFEPAFQDVVRFTTNSVIGFFGILDIASEFGLEHHYQNFGQTLGAWGMGAGAYVVLPLLGPSTVRDTIALPLDRSATPALVIDSTKVQVGVTVLQIINTRANLLGASRVIDDIALDKYTFVRDAYLQRRNSLVFDSDAPDTGDESSDDAVIPPGSAASAPSAPAPARAASAASRK